MNRRTVLMIVDGVLAVVCVVAAAFSWRQGVQTTEFAPMGEVPGFTATRYSGPWLVLAALLIAVAGLAMIDLVTRIVRGLRANHSDRNVFAAEPDSATVWPGGRRSEG
ncbi:hypothetical protein GV794_25015 [Nocardia cyriacigeorgica]|uniref:Uncharacterized protein n=1 Tax=Nocardia cyriacigeorgica TaxID=135487 RepID=A0A6P1DFE0_9NOCA|nr:hypothetical protein [Nocardia cyriacigeorgica]NEW39481.1 hypothetical protein [Nocardia cyriacigeorgica]NEW47142.1 hypothetical protein [Nocardia cyriacigeorgica]NEW53772.1 hypothetical protein [Nocardia cyriacigeorgica]NEW58874.1 hypothetical protein [Nocardia cyriacigeorgica]